MIRGYGAAALAVLIWASYPVVTRAGSFGNDDALAALLWGTLR